MSMWPFGDPDRRARITAFWGIYLLNCRIADLAIRIADQARQVQDLGLKVG